VEACTNCGKCVDVCPTGALFHKDDTTAEKQPHRERPALLRRAREHQHWQHQ
jgi:bidirectional [NiFe] hydrogenase diaphorase subunit